jgi:hypothetical protein
MQDNSIIEITLKGCKNPTYKMQILSIEKKGIRGFFRCNFGQGWEEIITDKATGEKSVGMILFEIAAKIEMVEEKVL